MTKRVLRLLWRVTKHALLPKMVSFHFCPTPSMLALANFKLMSAASSLFNLFLSINWRREKNNKVMWPQGRNRFTRRPSVLLSYLFKTTRKLYSPPSCRHNIPRPRLPANYLVASQWCTDHPWRWVQGGRCGEQMRGQERFSPGSPSPPPPAFHSNLMIMIFAEDDLCLHSVITQPASMISAIGNRWAIRGVHQGLLWSLLAFCYSAIAFNMLVTFLLHVFPNLLHGDCCQCG